VQAVGSRISRIGCFHSPIAGFCSANSRFRAGRRITPLADRLLPLAEQRFSPGDHQLPLGERVILFSASLFAGARAASYRLEDGEIDRAAREIDWTAAFSRSRGAWRRSRSAR
jgi:hypothetical protein